MKLSFDDICGGAEQAYNCADVDRVMYSIRNQLRKGWDARIHKLWCRMSDLQDEIDFDTEMYNDMYVERLNESMIRVERALRRARNIKNPWKV